MKQRRNGLYLAYISFFIAFIVFSCVFINPKQKQIHSTFRHTQLKSIMTSEGNSTRIDYFDSEGNLAVSADLGYATIIVTSNRNYKLEEYFDDEGNPVCKYTDSSGYCALLNEYDEKGNVVKKTYLDFEKKPVVTIEGYASEERIYDKEGRIKSVSYFDAKMEPICTASYGFGKTYDYNSNGTEQEITYLDEHGHPMMTGMGYAIVLQKLYPTEDVRKGKIKEEYYYDGEEKPVSLALGQFGVFKDYDENGENSVITYLNEYGDPIVTHAGYTTVVRKYKADNTIESENYFDIEGNPFTLSEGQHGVSYEYGKEKYVDINGKEIPNLKSLITNNSIYIICIALLTNLLSLVLNKRWNIVLLFVCCGAILYFTLLFREYIDVKTSSFALESYKHIITDSNARSGIIKNIWLFIPMGAVLFNLVSKKSILFVPLLLSVAIELIQKTLQIGFCEIDDIVSNGLGALIGFEMEKVSLHIIDLRKQKRTKISV